MNRILLENPIENIYERERERESSIVIVKHSNNNLIKIKITRLIQMKNMKTITKKIIIIYLWVLFLPIALTLKSILQSS